MKRMSRNSSLVDLFCLSGIFVRSWLLIYSRDLWRHRKIFQVPWFKCQSSTHPILPTWCWLIWHFWHVANAGVSSNRSTLRLRQWFQIFGVQCTTNDVVVAHHGSWALTWLAAKLAASRAPLFISFSLIDISIQISSWTERQTNRVEINPASQSHPASVSWHLYPGHASPERCTGRPVTCQQIVHFGLEQVEWAVLCHWDKYKRISGACCIYKTSKWPIVKARCILLVKAIVNEVLHLQLDIPARIY